jgi:DNA-binding MarR family transcriptional regulator
LDTESLARLRSVIHRMARHLNASSTAEGLTPTQASVLGVVSSQGPLGLAALTEIEGLNPTMLSRIVSRLGELGLISRRPDPADLRAVLVEATPEGLRLHKRIRTLRTAALAECLDRLDDAAVDRVVAALPALEALAEELRLDGAQPRRH